jgi:hypothetical protein
MGNTPILLPSEKYKKCLKNVGKGYLHSMLLHSKGIETVKFSESASSQYFLLVALSQ